MPLHLTVQSNGYIPGTTYTCLSTCQDAYESVINDIGCCINGFLNSFLFFNNITIQDYYSVCQIQDPGDCTTTFLDQSGGTITTVAKGLSLLAVFVGTAVHFYPELDSSNSVEVPS